MRRSRLIAVVSAGFLLVLVPSATAGATPLPIPPVSHASALTGSDDEGVLPSQVANAISRAQRLLHVAAMSVDGGNTVRAVASLKALPVAVLRADKAARRQMHATADPNADDESATGPDSVIAVLALDQTAIKTLAGLFDAASGRVLDPATHALFATLNTRAKLLHAVIALPEEGAGADYADGMADTVAGYDEEVAKLSEAQSDDTMPAGGKRVLTSALARSKKAQAAMAAAFGGGE